MTATNSPASDTANACPDCGEVHNRPAPTAPGFPIAVTPELSTSWRGGILDLTDDTISGLDTLEKENGIVPIAAVTIVHMSDDSIQVRSNGSAVMSVGNMYRALGKACDDVAERMYQHAEHETKVEVVQQLLLKILGR